MLIRSLQPCMYIYSFFFPQLNINIKYYILLTSYNVPDRIHLGKLRGCPYFKEESINVTSAIVLGYLNLEREGTLYLYATKSWESYFRE